MKVVVPAYNEERRLPDGLRALRPVGPAIRRLPGHRGDNGSTDRTAEIVREWPPGPVPVRLLACAARGKGVAVRAGPLATSAPPVGCCDADMATGLDVLGYLRYLLGNGDRVVIGRYRT